MYMDTEEHNQRSFGGVENLTFSESLQDNGNMNQNSRIRQDKVKDANSRVTS
jgi:hypothetical protein